MKINTPGTLQLDLKLDILLGYLVNANIHPQQKTCYATDHVRFTDR